MLNVLLIDVLLAFSNAIDLISPNMSNHQKRVAYIAYLIATEMGLDNEEKKDILTAGLLHDAGALHQNEILEVFKFDIGGSEILRHSHGYKGWKLFNKSEVLKSAAEMIKFHHVYWEECKYEHLKNYKIPLGSHIIHLADRVDTLINRNEEILNQSLFINETISNKSGKMFMPSVVEAFMKLSSKEFFWFDLTATFIEDIIKKLYSNDNTRLGIKEMSNMIDAFYQIIDFRSIYTSTHSIGVAVCAEAIAEKMEFSTIDTQFMYLAGLIHDIGKLAVPVEILEKNGKLTKEEFNIIKSHTFYSFRIIERIPGMEKINEWVSFHHEKINGGGYPFKLISDEINIGSKIMAVSDVFTALTEDRPYRQAMPVDEAVSIMNKMVDERHLDTSVFNVLKKNIQEINILKSRAQKSALERHDAFENIENIFMKKS